MKKTCYIFLSLLCCLIFNIAITSANILQNQQPNVQQSENYYLINDSSKTISDIDKEEITKELSTIFSEKPDNGIIFKIYTFLSDGDVSPTVVENEIISKFKIDHNITPIVFIYNLKTKDYKFIIDERISNHISTAYLNNATKTILINKNNINSSDLKEFLIRISTITSLAIKNDITNQYSLESDGEKINTNNFEIIDFSKLKTNNITKQEVTSNINNNNIVDSTNKSAVYILLISIFVTVVVFLKKKNKNKK